MDAINLAVESFKNPVRSAGGEVVGAPLRQAAAVRAGLAPYAAINSRVQNMAIAAGRLGAEVAHLAALPATVGPAEQVIHASQVQRLERHAGRVVDTYNATLNVVLRAGSGTSEQALARVAAGPELQRLGLTRNDDGTLQFNKENFLAQVQAGAAKMADLRGTFTALDGFATALAHAASGVNAEIQRAAAIARRQLGEVGGEPAAGEAATAREMLEAMVGSALNNSLSALGLGALIDLYA